MKSLTMHMVGLRSPCPYQYVCQKGWKMESARHHVLVAPSGGLSRESPGCSRRRWCWRLSTRMLTEETSEGLQGCWVELALDRCHQWVAQRRRQVLWSLNLCWWAWPGWVPSGYVGSPGISSDHSGPEEQQCGDMFIGITPLHSVFLYTQWI